MYPRLALAQHGQLAADRPPFLASDGTEVVGFTQHGIDRAIGDGAKRAGTRPATVLDAIKNPMKITEGVDNLGRPFKVYWGADARVVIDPETGRIVGEPAVRSRSQPITMSDASRLVRLSVPQVDYMAGAVFLPAQIREVVPRAPDAYGVGPLEIDAKTADAVQSALTSKLQSLRSMLH